MRKLAFIVGMSDYPEDILINPVNDADSIEDAFRKLGIDTIKMVNTGVADLKDALDHFREELKKYEVAIFFFAGHGTEIEGEYYLCTIDTDFKTLNRIRYSSLPLSYLIDLFEKTSSYTKIIILDACRDNPFEKKLRSVKGTQLAPVFAPLGTIIAYATSPGQIAGDGRDGNGAYTYALLQHIFTNDLKVEELFKRTRNTLYALTSKRQLSWEHTSLMGDFYFSNSALTGEFKSTYSKEAVADSTFNYAINTPVIGVVNALRSCNWDKQNPAIHKINSIDFDNSKIDEIFLLGRNIYQSGIGPAFDASGYLKSIHSNLSIFNDEVRFHILNGIVFEIYFNGSGILREEFKTKEIDIVFGELLDPKNRNSLEFVNSFLITYDFRFLYRPLVDETIILDIVCENYTEDLYRLKEVNHNGKNILFNFDGTNEYIPDDDIIRGSKDRLLDELINKAGVPSYKLSAHFVGLPDDEERLHIPYDFKLLNFPIRSKTCPSNQ